MLNFNYSLQLKESLLEFIKAYLNVYGNGYKVEKFCSKAWPHTEL